MKPKSKFQEYVYGELAKIAGESHQNKDTSTYGPDNMVWMWFINRSLRRSRYYRLGKDRKSIIDKTTLLALADRAAELGCNSYLMTRVIENKRYSSTLTCNVIPPDQLASAELGQVVIWCPVDSPI